MSAAQSAIADTTPAKLGEVRVLVNKQLLRRMRGAYFARYAAEPPDDECLLLAAAIYGTVSWEREERELL